MMRYLIRFGKGTILIVLGTIASCSLISIMPLTVLESLSPFGVSGIMFPIPADRFRERVRRPVQTENPTPTQG